MNITEKQWKVVNAALLKAIAVCGMHVPALRDEMIHASCVMDEIIDADEEDDDDDMDADRLRDDRDERKRLEDEDDAGTETD